MDKMKETEEKVTNYYIPDQLHNWKFEEYYKDKNQAITVLPFV